MTFQERYKYNPQTDLLGKGGFARVYKAKDTLLDREVAIKVFNTTDKDQYTVVEEIKKAIKLHHNNLLRYYDVAVLENKDALGEKQVMEIGVMEYANAGDLKQFARKNPGSPKLFALLQQVLNGLAYLHSKGIIHRDLKPQNILLVEEDGELTAKISDFGISKSMDAGTNSSSLVIGTIEYMAPEQFNPAKYGIDKKINTNVDLWSFGIMVHELIRHEPLFGQRSGNTTAEQIMNAILSSSLPPDVDLLPEPYKTIVKKCLVADATQRIKKANELYQFFEGQLQQNDNTGEETQVIDKNFLNRQINNSQETQVIEGPQITAPPEDENDGAGGAASRPEKTNYATGWVVGIVAITGILLGFYFYNRTPGIGDGQSEYNLAMQNINDTTFDVVTHLQKAADLGVDSAKLQLAKYYEDHNRYTDALPILRPMVDTTTTPITSKYGIAIKLYALAFINQKDGVGNPTGALQALMDCAAQNDADCAYQLGMIYYEGNLVKPNYTKADELFRKAAGQNNAQAECMLGNIYFMGVLGNTNYDEAIRWYFKSADHGNTVAMYALGLAYVNGTGVNKDATEAKKWLQQVVDKSDNPAAVTAAKQQLQGMQ